MHNGLEQQHQQGKAQRGNITNRPLVGKEEDTVAIVWEALDRGGTGEVTFDRFAEVLFEEVLPSKVGHHRQSFRPLHFQPIRCESCAVCLQRPAFFCLRKEN